MRLITAALALVVLSACGSSAKHAVPPAPTTTTTTIASKPLTTGLGGDTHRCVREKIATIQTAVEAYRAQQRDPKAAPTLAQLVQAQLLTAIPDGVTLDYADSQPSIDASC